MADREAGPRRADRRHGTSSALPKLRHRSAPVEPAPRDPLFMPATLYTGTAEVVTGALAGIGATLVALDLGIDTSTPGGRLVANVVASVAQWEPDGDLCLSETKERSIEQRLSRRVTAQIPGYVESNCTPSPSSEANR